MLELYISDFDIRQICESGQCFRMYEIPCGDQFHTGCEVEFEVYSDDKYIRIGQDNVLHRDGKKNRIVFDCEKDEFEEFWLNYFDIDTDYSQIKALVDETDPYMLRAVEFGDGIRILNQDLWEMIVSFLISQQNNIPRIRKCIENICKVYGEKKINKYGGEYFAFPRVEDLAILSEDALTECNLGYRSKYVVRTAKEILDGKYSLEAIKQMNYEDAKNTLLSMYGVGKKVADCVCLFGLHHINAFPIDTHIRQVMDREYNGSFPFDKYEGYLGIMQQYIFFSDLK